MWAAAFDCHLYRSWPTGNHPLRNEIDAALGAGYSPITPTVHTRCGLIRAISLHGIFPTRALPQKCLPTVSTSVPATAAPAAVLPAVRLWRSTMSFRTAILATWTSTNYWA
jgi:hypothetical protein